MMNAFARPNVSLGLGSNFKWHDHWRLRATRIRSPQMCDRGRPETSDPHTEASSGRPTSAQRHSASEVPEPSGAPYVLKRQISRWRRIDRCGQSVAIFGPRLPSQRGADFCPTSAFERRLLIDNASRNVATSRCAWVADPPHILPLGSCYWTLVQLHLDARSILIIPFNSWMAHPHAIESRVSGRATRRSRRSIGRIDGR